jgi:hypothetical protein
MLDRDLMTEAEARREYEQLACRVKYTDHGPLRDERAKRVDALYTVMIYAGPFGVSGHLGSTSTREFVIQGEDNAGWTLDDYVIPRLASGLHFAKEIDLSHPIMKEIPES